MIPDGKKRLSVTLPDNTVALLDRMAREHGVHRSTLIAAAVTLAMPSIDMGSKRMIKRAASTEPSRRQESLEESLEEQYRVGSFARPPPRQ